MLKKHATPERHDTRALDALDALGGPVTVGKRPNEPICFTIFAPHPISCNRIPSGHSRGPCQYAVTVVPTICRALFVLLLRPIRQPLPDSFFAEVLLLPFGRLCHSIWFELALQVNTH